MGLEWSLVRQIIVGLASFAEASYQIVTSFPLFILFDLFFQDRKCKNSVRNTICRYEEIQ